MKHILENFNISSLDVKREEAQAEKTLDPRVNDVVNKIFAKFYGICRGFDKQYQDTRRLTIEKGEWVIEFTRLGLNSMEKVELALQKTRSTCPTNTPKLSEFIAWCTPSPEDLGLWEKENAYKYVFPILREDLVQMSAAQETIMRHAISQTGRFELKTQPESSSRPVFERNYEIATRDFMSGKLKPIAKGLEDRHIETQELKARSEIAKGFEHVKDYKSGMTEIKKILGMA